MRPWLRTDGGAISQCLRSLVLLLKVNLKWPAPGLDDTQLSKSGLPLELHRAQITDRRVSAFRVVEALDIVKHVCLCNHSAGQIPRCFAMKENFTSIPSRSRPRLFLVCPAPPSASSLRA